MANLGDLKDDNTKKRTIIITVVAVVLICVFMITAFISNGAKKTDYTDEKNIIAVHVKGAVKKSGYYEVKYGTRVREIIDIAGGFDENAFVDGVNLAAYLKDGEEIVVPYRGSVENGAFNLNTVTEEELYTLVDGIGEDRARQIINYRETHGGFVSVLELDDVLGKTTAKKLYDKFYVGK
ncbi:MAG: helix-hairpin-helix domain-containing protein [Clostridia bacterium]|nr:helix-hairpin-helix domain-containing protein [Clostridia bacterium]